MLTSYLVANAIILPMGAWFSMLLGRKRFYMICVGAVHGQQPAVRHGAHPGTADLLPRPAGARRRRAAAHLAGHPGGEFSAREAGHGDGGLRHGRGGGAGHRSHPRRLDHRQLQLGLDLLHQPSGRHPLAGADLLADSRSALPGAQELRRAASRWTTWASACSRSAWARSKSCSTKASATIGSPPTSS